MPEPLPSKNDCMGWFAPAVGIHLNNIIEHTHAKVTAHDRQVSWGDTSGEVVESLAYPSTYLKIRVSDTILHVTLNSINGVVVKFFQISWLFHSSCMIVMFLNGTHIHYLAITY